MVGRALMVTLGLFFLANTARAEEPGDAQRAIEIIDPYAEPEPRLVEVVDPYAETEQPASEKDLERVCENYCLARRDVLLVPRRELPPPRPTEEWAGEREREPEPFGPSARQALGGIVLGLTALGATALFAGISEGNGSDFSGAYVLGGAAVGAGLVLGVALVLDGGDGKTEVQVAGLSR